MPRVTKKKALAKKPSTDVAAIREALKKQRVQSRGALGISGGSQIKVNDDLTITMPDGTSGEELSVVVIDYHARKTQYDTAPQVNNPVPPDCWALAEPASMTTNAVRGDIHSSLTPDERVAEPKASECAGCPMNEFGTNALGSGKGCNDRYWLVLAGAGSGDGALAEANINVSSKRNWEAYVATLDSQYELTPLEVVTIISATRGANNSKVLHFTYGSDNENLAAHFARLPEAQQMLQVGFQPATSHLPKATAKKKARAAKRRATRAA